MVRPPSRTHMGLPAIAAAITLLAGGGAAGVAGQGGPPSQKQVPTPTFRTQVNVVEVDAVVLDQQGRFVSDLRQEDFEVLEDGKPQALISVQVVNIPIERLEKPLFAARPVQPDVETNARPFDGRLYLIVLDDLHTLSVRTTLVRRIAREFIQRNVASNDLAAVVTTSGNRKSSQEFTNNRSLLLQAVEKFVGQKVISPALAGLAQTGTPETDSPSAAAAQRIFNARSTLETLATLANFAGTIRSRRKAMVMIGEGIDYRFGRMEEMPDSHAAGGDPVLGFVDQGSAPRELRDRVRDFVAAANRANLTLYAFDPRVFTQGGDDLVDIASNPPGDVDAKGEIVKSVNLRDDLVAAQDNLRTLSTETGGFAVTGSPKAVAGAFDRVRAENSNYYILGYSPANEARDGKFRRIEVRVRRPGLKVEARKGYTAPRGSAPAPPTVDAKEGTSRAVREALASTLPVSGLTLRAAAAPFKGVAPNASVVVLVQTEGRQMQFTPKGDKLEDSVELSVIAVDRLGKARGGERQDVDMPLSPPLRAFVAQAGVVFQMRVSLPPGQYQLRIAARDGGSGRVGSVHYHLEVPDFLSAPLAMSGLVLTAEEAGEVPAPRPDEVLGKLLPGTPITTREFNRTDSLTALAEIYDNQDRQSHSVWIKATVRAEDGRAMFQQEERRFSTELGGVRGGFGYTVRVPLRELGPGLYVLTIEARSGLGADITASRELQFRVR